MADEKTLGEIKREYKIAAKQKRLEAIYARAERRCSLFREWRCFWTRPRRHIFERRVSGYQKVCVVCGAVRDTGDGSY